MKNSHQARFSITKKKAQSQLQLVASKKMPFQYVESYKSLRTNLNFIASTNDVHSFVITSALPEESKSNVAINLAVTLASSDKKVVIVDCDLRKPVIHKYLKMGHNTRGLTSVLSGEVPLEKSIYRLDELNIHVLTAGVVPPNPSELLAQDKMKQVVETLKKHFDYVILDAPPVSVVTDAAVLGTYADGAIMVVRSCFAPRETIQLAKKKLDDVGVKIFGVVLTRFNARKASRNSGYSYSYGYEHYKE